MAMHRQDWNTNTGLHTGTYWHPDDDYIPRVYTKERDVAFDFINDLHEKNDDVLIADKLKLVSKFNFNAIEFGNLKVSYHNIFKIFKFFIVTI